MMYTIIEVKLIFTFHFSQRKQLFIIGHDEWAFGVFSFGFCVCVGGCDDNFDFGLFFNRLFR